MTNVQHHLILASSSPRRQELIRTLGIPYSIRVSNADETTAPGMLPQAIVESLSLCKAQTVLDLLTHEERSDKHIIGSDTIVVLDGEVLGKPRNERDAHRMLTRLQGRVHEVYSGVAVIQASDGKYEVAHNMTRVTMKPLDAAAIDRYIATGEPMDKAGSYAIQGIGATMVTSIEGDYFNVVGLPLSLLSDLLAKFGIRVL
ncbi:septum formation protein Maf [Paenibacillus swuensis]|uniref:dTTP/UTP pyrophosphatase n=1 Tax=Paenibacillus swuensis TaxID=1178515 RepID=A0A172TJL8_9BACL|nr:Maf family protein [Paenibacillus swuensis]ANE47166.1 septum formation protein Maf [Paenibacillus swuensis]